MQKKTLLDAALKIRFDRTFILFRILSLSIRLFLQNHLKHNEALVLSKKGGSV